jgi:hypothetical protein
MSEDDFEDDSEYGDPCGPEPEPVRPVFSVSQQVDLLATGQATDVLHLRRESFDLTFIGVRLEDADGQTRIDLTAGDRPTAVLLGLITEGAPCLTLPTEAFNACGGADVPVGYRAGITFRTRHTHQSKPGYVEECKGPHGLEGIERNREEVFTVTTALHFVANKGLPYQQRPRLAALPD